jgi:hypothetical protein
MCDDGTEDSEALGMLIIQIVQHYKLKYPECCTARVLSDGAGAFTSTELYNLL